MFTDLFSVSVPAQILFLPPELLLMQLLMTDANLKIMIDFVTQTYNKETKICFRESIFSELNCYFCHQEICGL